MNSSIDQFLNSSNWGRWGDNDQIGCLNLIGENEVLRGLNEVKVGKNFCLSLPLDLPILEKINKFRKPPKIMPTIRNDEIYYNFDWSKVNKNLKDVASDDFVVLHNQFSTHWDGLAHRGAKYQIGNSNEVEMLYFNGYKANINFKIHKEGTVKALALGVEHMAKHGLQTRGVLINLHKHFGNTETKAIGYKEITKVIEEENITISSGDILCFWTGLDQNLLSPDVNLNTELVLDWMGLDGNDKKLLEWLHKTNIAAIVSDNRTIEYVNKNTISKEISSNLPLHEYCLFRLGMPLGELWLLSELAEWLDRNGRSYFLLTAPPLNLTGAIGSPVTPIATV
jgi:kynurenine formamidase